MYAVKFLIDVLIRTMFSEKDQCHEKSHWTRDIGTSDAIRASNSTADRGGYKMYTYVLAML